METSLTTTFTATFFEFGTGMSLSFKSEDAELLKIFSRTLLCKSNDLPEALIYAPLMEKFLKDNKIPYKIRLLGRKTHYLTYVTKSVYYFTRLLYKWVGDKKYREIYKLEYNNE